jgi:ketosteroid isomerase-like protein
MSGTDFQTFWAARTDAAKAYVVGDGSELDELVPQAGEATFFSPLGDVVTGAAEVAGRYRHDSEAFHPDGTTHFEVLHSFQDGDLAFWTGYETARVHVGSMPDAKDMRSRVTEVFRRIGGSWKLVHRHADHQEVTVRTPATLNDAAR